MDTFAHGFWSYAIFHKKKHALLATFFGVIPDLLSFGILFVINLVNGNLSRGLPSIISIPKWLFAAYNLTHSFVMFFAVFLIIFIFTKKWYWPLTAWAIHILIDIPTHSTRFFPTPFLWPLSDYRFNGISWATGWFMVLNYSALIVVLFLIARDRRKKGNPKKKVTYYNKL